MRYELDIRKVRYHLHRALELVPQDRWVLGGLRDGELKVLADSRPEADRPFQRTRELASLAKRACFERRPLTVTSVIENPLELGRRENWELDWPSLLYAPVGVPGIRPVGLLILGHRKEHWYTQEEIDYVAALAITLTTAVVSFSGPLGRLTLRQRNVAQLVSEGLSIDEIATAQSLSEEEAKRAVAQVLRKLSLRSPQQLADLLPEFPTTAGGVLL